MSASATRLNRPSYVLNKHSPHRFVFRLNKPKGFLALHTSWWMRIKSSIQSNPEIKPTVPKGQASQTLNPKCAKPKPLRWSWTSPLRTRVQKTFIRMVLAFVFDVLGRSGLFREKKPPPFPSNASFPRMRFSRAVMQDSSVDCRVWVYGRGLRI